MAPAKLHRVSENSKGVLISLNPKSGSSNRKKLVDALSDELNSRGFECEILTNLEKLKQRCEQLQAQDQLRTVVSAGGDGTASLLVNELDASVAYTVFPLGTANLLAQHVKASLDVSKTAEVISGGNVTQMDVGEANGKIFLVVASCGFDADVVDRIHGSRTGHINYWSYGMPLMNSILKYKFPKMRVTADGDALEPSCWTFVLNVPRYALGLKFVQDASAADGQLDVCTFNGGGFFKGLYYFFNVLFGNHKSISATEFARFKSLTIESDENIPYELDGDPGGYLPLSIRVIPDRMTVMVPPGWDES